MRERRKREKPYNRTDPYFRPPELKGYKRRYLEDKELMPFFVLMYNSLDERRLETMYIEAPKKMRSKHKIRINKNTNPEWFRYLCSQYLEDRKSKRKGSRKRKGGKKYTDTKIQAIDTQKALRNLIKNGYSHSLYFEDYIKIAGRLRKEYSLEEKLYEAGKSESIINNQCYWIRDLKRISWELEKNEPFKIANGFPNYPTLDEAVNF
jgi:hypothetical protein